MLQAICVIEGFERLTKSLADWKGEVLCYRVGEENPFCLVAGDAPVKPCPAERLAVEDVLGSVLMVEGLLAEEDLDREYLEQVEGRQAAGNGAAMVQMEGRGRCFVLLPA